MNNTQYNVNITNNIDVTKIDAKPSTPSVAFYTLGCKLNQSETDSMAESLQIRGFNIVNMKDLFEKKQHADFLVINTCTVTAKADRKTRHSIYRALQLANIPATNIHAKTQNKQNKYVFTPNTYNATNDKKSVVIVTGCFVGNDNKELVHLPIDYIIDNSKKEHIPDIIDAHFKGHTLDISTLENNYFGGLASQGIFRTRSNLKIQDGCDNFCSFCIIPTVRGKARSKELSHIMQDARILIERGTKEIVLTGVNMSRYADNNYKFSDVLKALTKLPGKFRIRISSLEPDDLDDAFFNLLHHPKICPHLHLCLQSGSEKILLQMRRMYTQKKFIQCVEKIKSQNSLFNFTTDIIVGFPTETNEDFNKSLQTVKDVGFSHVHVFPYSNRLGTRASRMQAVNNNLIKQRISTLTKLNLLQKNAYRLKVSKVTQNVLIEKITKDKHGNSFLEGLSEYYVPIKIQFKPKEHTFDNFLNKIIKIIAQKTVYHQKNKEEIVLFSKLENTAEIIS